MTEAFSQGEEKFFHRIYGRKNKCSPAVWRENTCACEYKNKMNFCRVMLSLTFPFGAIILEMAKCPGNPAKPTGTHQKTRRIINDFKRDL